MLCSTLRKDSGTSSIRWYGLFRSTWSLLRGRMGPAVSGFFQSAEILTGHLREIPADIVMTVCLSAC